MGKATGFLDYERQDKKAEAPKERISHFREFHKPLTEEEQKKQGARCMDCGVPFCQAGMMLSLIHICSSYSSEYLDLRIR